MRSVPEDVYEALAEAAEANHQTLNAYVIDRLADAARVAAFESYPPPGDGLAGSVSRRRNDSD